jgi:hypothetical protein
MSILDLIEAMGRQERQITDRVIVSPVFNNCEIVTKLSGLLHTFLIRPTEPGWHKFKPIDLKRADCIGQADFFEITEYLKLLPKIRITLVFRQGMVYYGVPSKNNGRGFKSSDLVPVLLPGDTATDFSTCLCRFDGMNVWFQSVDVACDLYRVDFLSASLTKQALPESLRCPGLTLEERIAYSIRFKMDEAECEARAEAEKREQEEKSRAERLRREQQRDKSIKGDVEFAGGKFVKNVERMDHFSVTYEVDGNVYTSVVSKEPTRQILSAGICLSGTDKEYDLKTLVSVIREGQNRDLIHRTSRDW